MDYLTWLSVWVVKPILESLENEMLVVYGTSSQTVMELTNGDHLP